MWPHLVIRFLKMQKRRTERKKIKQLSKRV